MACKRQISLFHDKPQNDGNGNIELGNRPSMVINMDIASNRSYPGMKSLVCKSSFETNNAHDSSDVKSLNKNTLGITNYSLNKEIKSVRHNNFLTKEKILIEETINLISKMQKEDLVDEPLIVEMQNGIKDQNLEKKPDELQSITFLATQNSLQSSSPTILCPFSPKTEGECTNMSVVSHKFKEVPFLRRGKRKKYQKYTPHDRIAIGKYCFEHGPAAARKAFQLRYPEMSESVTRGFRDKYKSMIGEAAVYEFEQNRRQVDLLQRKIQLPRGRPRKYRAAEDDASFSPIILEESIIQKPCPGILDTNDNNQYNHGIKKRSKSPKKVDANAEREILLERGTMVNISPVQRTRDIEESVTTSEHNEFPPSIKSPFYNDISPNSENAKSPDVARELKSHSPLHQNDGRFSSFYAVQSSSHVPIIHYPKSKVYELLPTSHTSLNLSQAYTSSDQTHLDKNSTFQIQLSDSDRKPSSSILRGKRCKYQKYTPEERFNIGKLCDEIGLNATVKLYREQYPRLNESVVRTFRSRYRQLVDKGNGTPKAGSIRRKLSRRKNSHTLEDEECKLADVKYTEDCTKVNPTKKLFDESQSNKKDFSKRFTSASSKEVLTKKLNGLNDTSLCIKCHSILVCPKC